MSSSSSTSTGPEAGDDPDQHPAEDAAPGATSYRRLLRTQDFRNLLSASLASSLGDWIGVFAILSLTALIEGSGRAGGFAVAGVMTARVLPNLLFGPIAGVYADRWDRKRTMIVTDLFRAAVMFLLVFSGSGFQLFFATLLVEIASMLFVPSKDATLPNVVDGDDLVVANQMNLLVTYGTLPIGAGLFAGLDALAGLVFDTGFLGERSEALPIWVNAGTFLVSALFISRLRLPEEERRRSRIMLEGGDEKNALQELQEGLAFVVRHGLMGGLVIGVMGAFFAAGVVVGVGPFFVTLVNAAEWTFGLLGVFVGLGLIVGVVSAARLSNRFDKERLFSPAIGVAGVALLLTSYSPRLDVAIPLVTVMGAGAGLALLVGYTMIQEHADDELRGRTFAAFNTGARVALFLALVFGGFLVGVLGRASAGEDGVYGYAPFDGARLTLAIAGLVAIAGAVWSGRAIYRALTSETRERLVVPSPHGLAGLFVVFEGGEGAGKTTQIERLAASLEAATDIEVVVTREPGGTPLGERLREVVLDNGTGEVVGRAEALLFAAARAQHVEQVIKPALERGAIVISDRYVDSSVVYQGHARGLGGGNIERLNRWATNALEPDMVVLLDIDASVGLARAGRGDVEPDRLERAGEVFHEVVNAGFRSRAATGATSSRSRWLVLDASRDPDEINDRVLHAMGIEPAKVEEVQLQAAETGQRDTLVMHTGELRAALTGEITLDELAELERRTGRKVPDLTPPDGTERPPPDELPPPPSSA